MTTKKATKATTKEATKPAIKKPTIEQVQEAIAAGMEPVKAVHATIQEIENFHATEEKRLVQVAKKEAEKMKVVQSFKEGMVKFHQLHSGIGEAERVAATVIFSHILEKRSLPEPGQKRDFKDITFANYERLFDKPMGAWNGNTALLSAGCIAGLRLAIHLMQSPDFLKAMQENPLHYAESRKMKRK